MQTFKKHWEISKNWQLIYPIFGVLGLVYSAYKLSVLIFKHKEDLLLNIFGALVLFFLLLKLTLLIFKKLEKRWVVNEKWQIIRIFIIFAITGTSSIFLTSPIFESIGLHKATFSDSVFLLILYYIIKFFAILPIYKVLLLVFGWMFGEYNFFRAFVLKMVNRFLFKKSVKE